MELKQLTLFVEVTQKGSFASVARDRDMDPSSVSRAISLLEHELGFRLFQRTTRRLALTEAGEHYLEQIQLPLDELEQARDRARSAGGEPTGTLRLTASVAFGQTLLVGLLPRFQEAFPQLRLELLLSDARLDLIAERIDLAIRLGPDPSGDFVAVRLFPTRYRVCASPEYVKTHAPIGSPADLTGHRCLLFALPRYRTRWHFRKPGMSEQTVPISGDLVISNALALRDCARAGLGPVLLADWLIGTDLAEGSLVDLLPDYEATATDFSTAAWAIYPSRSLLPIKVRLVLDFLKQHLAR